MPSPVHTPTVASAPSSPASPPSTRNGRRFRVALSFPGEHRALVEPIAHTLAGVHGEAQILYDRFHAAELARPNLDVYLPELYRLHADLVVILLCPEYARKQWCRLEWRHIRALIATTEEDRIMFLSAGAPGDLSVLGILSGDGYIDVTGLAPDEVSGLIQARIASLEGGGAIATDVSIRQRFEVQIAEARAKIAELEGEYGSSPMRATPRGASSSSMSIAGSTERSSSAAVLPDDAEPSPTAKRTAWPKGPWLVALSLSLGSGEFILWPYITMRCGAITLYAIVVAAALQVPLSLAVAHYAVRTGNSFVTGFFRHGWPGKLFYTAFILCFSTFSLYALHSGTIAVRLVVGFDSKILSEQEFIDWRLIVSLIVGAISTYCVVKSRGRYRYMRRFATVAVAGIVILSLILVALVPRVDGEAVRVSLLDPSILPVLVVSVIFTGLGGFYNILYSVWLAGACCVDVEKVGARWIRDGRFDHAALILDNAIERNGHTPELVNLRDLARSLDYLYKSKGESRKGERPAVTSTDGGVLSNLRYGAVLACHGRYQESLEVHLQLLDADAFAQANRPWRARLLYNCAYLYRKQSQREEARTYADQALELLGTEDDRLRAALELIAERRSDANANIHFICALSPEVSLSDAHPDALLQDARWGVAVVSFVNLIITLVLSWAALKFAVKTPSNVTVDLLIETNASALYKTWWLLGYLYLALAVFFLIDTWFVTLDAVSRVHEQTIRWRRETLVRRWALGLHTAAAFGFIFVAQSMMTADHAPAFLNKVHGNMMGFAMPVCCLVGAYLLRREYHGESRKLVVALYLTATLYFSLVVLWLWLQWGPSLK